VLEASTDLQNWEPLEFVSATNSYLGEFDFGVGTLPPASRFFRIQRGF
jgi:hypothetical protein